MAYARLPRFVQRRKPMQKKTETPIEPTAYRIANPEEFARNMLRLFEEGGRAMSGILERGDSKVGPWTAASEMTEAGRSMTDVVRKIIGE